MKTGGLVARRTIEILAPVERVWRAITDPEELTRWKTRTAEVDLRTGGRYRFYCGWGESGEGTILEVQPPHRLRYDDADGSVVTYTLEPVPGGTRVTLLVEAFGPEEDLRWWREVKGVGYRRTFDNLKTVLEHGDDRRSTFWRTTMGVSGFALPAELRAETGAASGAYLYRVFGGGPADRAGLRPGDAVVAVDGAPVRSYTDLLDALWPHEAGDEVTLTCVRRGSRLTATVRLEARDPG